ncbi:hypothetical protein GUITHDRAFT_139289 [Guillardia theta CCMP2712]|uniref:Uncharacterized protein n=2 Tax=Guillardia theta TaxID=55529 RepID=L1J9K8_GUITC|nr:hypothetical protein GUITHDRAFT_139289 [Guillardia theta CCMP2712]EKX45012.1 hypothetical protein GUITHDRAFT_139289 [Guillardia theta CCMP2712]|eukprot:XP_005831992.1 hypothetical protein GUITHDRAFT_139289 [Guillardia theta CCMP2712]
MDVTHVISSLYEEKPFTSKIDGRRFKNKEDLDRHLDMLFERNRAKKERFGNQERLWFRNISEWCRAEDISSSRTPLRDFNKSKDGIEKAAEPIKLNVVQADDLDGLAKCAACNEVLKKEWRADEDRWVLHGVYRMNGNGEFDDHGTIFVHQGCFQG